MLMFPDSWIPSCFHHLQIPKFNIKKVGNLTYFLLKETSTEGSIVCSSICVFILHFWLVCWIFAEDTLRKNSLQKNTSIMQKCYSCMGKVVWLSKTVAGRVHTWTCSFSEHVQGVHSTPEWVHTLCSLWIAAGPVHLTLHNWVNRPK